MHTKHTYSKDTQSHKIYFSETESRIDLRSGLKLCKDLISEIDHFGAKRDPMPCTSLFHQGPLKINLPGSILGPIMYNVKNSKKNTARMRPGYHMVLLKSHLRTIEGPMLV